MNYDAVKRTALFEHYSFCKLQQRGLNAKIAAHAGVFARERLQRASIVGFVQRD
jgi:hypothetical protein